MGGEATQDTLEALTPHIHTACCCCCCCLNYCRLCSPGALTLTLAASSSALLLASSSALSAAFSLSASPDSRPASLQQQELASHDDPAPQHHEAVRDTQPSHGRTHTWHPLSLCLTHLLTPWPCSCPDSPAARTAADALCPSATATGPSPPAPVPAMPPRPLPAPSTSALLSHLGPSADSAAAALSSPRRHCTPTCSTALLGWALALFCRLGRASPPAGSLLLAPPEDLSSSR